VFTPTASRADAVFRRLPNRCRGTPPAMVPAQPVVAWLLGLMVQAAPPAILAEKPQLPLHEETAEQKVARYTDIAEDLYLVMYDPKTVPLFSGPKGRAATAALVLGVAF